MSQQYEGGAQRSELEAIGEIPQCDTPVESCGEFPHVFLIKIPPKTKTAPVSGIRKRLSIMGNLKEILTIVAQRKEFLSATIPEKNLERFVSLINQELIKLQQTPLEAKDILDFAYLNFVITHYEQQYQLLQDSLKNRCRSCLHADCETRN